MLPKDERFREWAGACDEDGAVSYIRVRCNVRSRAKIAEDEEVYLRFLAMETDYRMATGLLPSPR
jgi:hypothetical protein